jgi:hypothetical protein
MTQDEKDEFDERGGKEEYSPEEVQKIQNDAVNEGLAEYARRRETRGYDYDRASPEERARMEQPGKAYQGPVFRGPKMHTNYTTGQKTIPFPALRPGQIHDLAPWEELYQKSRGGIPE